MSSYQTETSASDGTCWIIKTQSVLRTTSLETLFLILVRLQRIFCAFVTLQIPPFLW